MFYRIVGETGGGRWPAQRPLSLFSPRRCSTVVLSLFSSLSTFLSLALALVERDDVLTSSSRLHLVRCLRGSVACFCIVCGVRWTKPSHRGRASNLFFSISPPPNPLTRNAGADAGQDDDLEGQGEEVRHEDDPGGAEGAVLGGPHHVLHAPQEGHDQAHDAPGGVDAGQAERETRERDSETLKDIDGILPGSVFVFGVRFPRFILFGFRRWVPGKGK